MDSQANGNRKQKENYESIEWSNLQVTKKEYMLNKIKVHMVKLKYNYKSHHVVQE